MKGEAQQEEERVTKKGVDRMGRIMDINKGRIEEKECVGWKVE